MPQDLIVIGAGGFGRETLNVVDAINRASDEPVWNVVGVIDEAEESSHLDRLAKRGYRHLGPFAFNTSLLAETPTVIGIGSPQARAKVAAQLPGPVAGPLVHPAAVVAPETTLAPGVVVCAGVQLSTNVTLAKHVHVNPGAIVGHDAVLDEFVSVNPGAVISGEVRVQQETLIGAGAVILQGLSVGARVTVGASACVTKDIDAGLVVVGIPARSMEAR